MSLFRSGAGVRLIISTPRLRALISAFLLMLTHFALMFPCVGLVVVSYDCSYG